MEKFATEFQYIYNKSQKKKTPKKTTEKISTRIICKQCGISNSSLIDDTTANKLCSNCGCIQRKIFTTNAEWRFYGYSDDKYNDPTRCGLPIDELLPKSSLSIKIKYVGSKYISLVRLQRWNIIHPEERSLFAVFKFMDKILLHLKITQATKIQAKQYYKILSAKDNRKGTLTRGVIRKSFIAACIFVSCKNHATPIQKTTIATICGITKFDMTKGFKKFSILEKNKNIQLNKPNFNNDNVHNLLRKFCIQLNYTKIMEDFSHIICDRLPKLKILQDTNHISITAGLLYYISVLFFKNTQYKTNILDLIKTSVVTLQKVYKILKKYETYLLIGLHRYRK